MPIEVREFEETPNPNAVKCLLDRAVLAEGAGPRSSRSAAAAIGDPIAEKLFAIEGVTTVLVGRDWVTVNKRADADWKRIKAAVREALRRVE